MSENDGDLAAYVAKHPRMAGALLTILLALSQVGTAAANHGSSFG